MEEPFVSICIPNYNYGQYIGETIKSLLNQTHKNFELIISDNASTDNSMDVINSFSDPRIRVYENDRNIGGVANANKCFGYAKADYIAGFCSDDIYHRRIVEYEVKGLSEFDYVGAAVSNQTPDLDEFRKQENQDVTEIKIYTQLNFLKYLFSGETLASSLMLTRECYEQIPFGQGIFLQAPDQDFILRIAAQYGLALVNDIKLFKRGRSRELSVEEEKSWIHEYELLKGTAKGIYMASTQKKALKKLYTYFIVTQDRNICRRSMRIGDYKQAKKHLVLYMRNKLAIANDEQILNWVKLIDDAPL